MLRRLGITVETAREAVATQHAEQLASLGITAHTPSPGRITFHETEAVQWGPSPLAVIKESAQGKSVATPQPGVPVGLPSIASRLS